MQCDSPLHHHILASATHEYYNEQESDTVSLLVPARLCEEATNWPGTDRHLIRLILYAQSLDISGVITAHKEISLLVLIFNRINKIVLRFK